MGEVIDVRYERLFRRALETELNRWGRWIERHSDYEGYPGVNILEAFLMGRGGGIAGHRILCLDMPTDVYSVHHRVLMLTDTLQESVWIYYVTRVKTDGTLWTLQERCKVADIEEKTLRNRLSDARRQLLGITNRASSSGNAQVHSPLTSANCA